VPGDGEVTSSCSGTVGDPAPGDGEVTSSSSGTVGNLVGLGRGRFTRVIQEFQSKSGSGAMSVHGLFFEFSCGACSFGIPSSSYNISRYSESDPDDDPDDDELGLDGFTNVSGFAVDDAGFGTGTCITLVDPWSGPGGAELDDACASEDAGLDTGDCTTFVDTWSGPSGAEIDDACASDDSTGFCNVLKYSSAKLENLSKSSPPRFPDTVIASLGMCTALTHA
jgi:hypothetical protein